MKNIIYIMLALLAISCEKDKIENEQKILINETISGNVSFENIDLCCDVQVAIVKEIQSDTFDTLSITTIDSLGNYKFENVIPEQEDLFITLVGVEYQIKAEDTTPDGDEGEMGPKIIGVYVEDNENDDGNNFLISSCMATISGKVLLSTIGELSPLPNQPINLYSNTNDSPGDLLSTTNTNQNGYYSFELEHEMLDAIIVLDTAFSPTSINPIPLQGYDNSLENNETVLAANNQIHCLIEDSCIADMDNNFIVGPTTAVSGYVLIDTDNDGIGDEPAPGKRVELHHRTAEHMPITPLLGGESTDANGHFLFPISGPGEYVLYYIGDGSGPGLVASYDQDQEAGEPNGSQVIFIPVNILNVGDTDENNYFILSD